MERDLAGPASGVAFQDEGLVDGEVGTEERLVAATTAGIADDHEPERLIAERTIPEGGAAEDERGDLAAVEGERQRVPAPPGRRHRLRSGQAVATLARPATLTGPTAPGPCPEGGVQPQATEHLDIGWATFQERSGGVGAVDDGVDGASVGPAGHQREQFAG